MLARIVARPDAAVRGVDPGREQGADEDGADTLRLRLAWWLRVAPLAGGLVVLLSSSTGISTGIVSTGEQGGGGRESASVVYVPEIDADSSRLAAIDHLVSLGVSRDEATVRIRKQSGQVRAAEVLREKAPESVQSVWIDDDGVLRASVVNEAGARAARAVGARPKRAVFSTEDLEGARDTLLRDVKENPPPGLSSATFEIDSARGKLVARYLFDDAAPVVPTAAGRFGDMVIASAEVGRVRTREDVDVAGYEMHMVGADTLCTAGWAVEIADPDGGPPGHGVMTAGHCFNPGDPRSTTYEINTTAAGNTQATGEFFVMGEEGDYGYLRLERDRATTRLFGGFVAEAIKEPVEGVTVCMEGATTYEACGTLERERVTTLMKVANVNYTIGNQMRADFCSDDGDSGAPVYMDFDEARGPGGVAAVGILSSSRTSREGDFCDSYFTPLSRVPSQDRFFVRIDGG